MKIPTNHPDIPKQKIGVLLINLGTPDATDYFSMRKYLKEFLSDRRVIEIPKFIWSPILNLFILTFRPGKSGKLYKTIWDNEMNQSPLRVNTERQAENLKKLIKKSNLKIDWAMRYGNPSIPSKINELVNAGCTKLLVFPMYPQYSATTTASVMDKVFETARMYLKGEPVLKHNQIYGITTFELG